MEKEFRFAQTPTDAGNRRVRQQLDSSVPATTSPHLPAVVEAHEEWMLRYRIVSGPEMLPAYRAMDFARFAAMVWPNADEEGTRLAADFLGFVFISDDQFDLHPEFSAAQVRFLVDQLLTVFDPSSPEAPADAPGIQALADLRRRWAQGMPASWIRQLDARRESGDDHQFAAQRLRHRGDIQRVGRSPRFRTQGDLRQGADVAQLANAVVPVAVATPSVEADGCAFRIARRAIILPSGRCDNGP